MISVEIPGAKETNFSAYIIDISEWVLKSVPASFFNRRMQIDISAIHEEMYVLKVISEGKIVVTKPIILK